MAYSTQLNTNITIEPSLTATASQPDPGFYISYYNSTDDTYNIIDGDTGTNHIFPYVDLTNLNDGDPVKWSDAAGGIVKMTVQEMQSYDVWDISGTSIYYNTGNVGIGMIPDTLFTIQGTSTSFFWYDDEEFGITDANWTTHKTGGSAGFRLSAVDAGGSLNGVGRSLLKPKESLYNKNLYNGDVFASFTNEFGNAAAGMFLFVASADSNAGIWLGGGGADGANTDHEFRIEQTVDGIARILNYTTGTNATKNVYPYMDFGINNASGGNSPGFRWFYEYGQVGGPKTVMRTNLYRQLFLYNTTDPARPTLVWEGGSGTGFWSYDANATIDASVGGTHVFQISASSVDHVGSFNGSWTAPSDRRLKENIKTIDHGLDKVLQLNPVEYDWIKDGKHAIGFIAQEVEEVLPEVVRRIKFFGEDTYTMEYHAIIPVLVNAIKELKKEIDSLKN